MSETYRYYTGKAVTFLSEEGPLHAREFEVNGEYRTELSEVVDEVAIEEWKRSQEEIAVATRARLGNRALRAA